MWKAEGARKRGSMLAQMLSTQEILASQCAFSHPLSHLLFQKIKDGTSEI